MSAVLLGLAAGMLFGALAVATRWGLSRGADPETGALVSTAVGTLVALVFVVAAGARPADFQLSELWPFLVIGAAVPGLSSLLFIQAVAAIGPSRTAVLIGTAPLFSAVLAIAFLGERPNAALWLGTLLVLAGGFVLVGERVRPEGFRVVGAVLAVACALLFAGRDNVARWASGEASASALPAALATLAAAAAFLLVYLLTARRDRLRRASRSLVAAFFPAGIALGLAYVALIVAFDRGRVTVVAPLNATQALWGVVFAALVVGASEALGRHLVLAALLVVAGSALIGIYR